MAIVRQPPPAVVPIAGYQGADPVRAFQGMQGGITPQGVSTIGQQMYGGAGVPRTGAGTPIDTSQTFVNSHLAPPGVKVKQAETAFLPPALPSLAQGIQQAGASRPGINPNAPPLTANSGQYLTDSVRNPVPRTPIDTSQQAINANLAPPDVKVNQAATAFKPISSVSRGVQTAGANHSLGSTVGGVSGAVNGGNIAGAKSPVAAVPSALTTTATGKLDGASAFGGGNRTAPSGFTSFNAADPNRALKMMRGY